MTRLRRLTATVAATALAAGALLALSAGSAGAFPLTKVAPADNLTNGKVVKIITQTLTYKPGSGPITVTQCSSDLALAPGFGGPSPAPSANCHADTSIGALGVLTGNTAIQVFADSKGKLVNSATLLPYTMSVTQGQMNHEFTAAPGVKLGLLQGYGGASHADADCAPPVHRVLNSAIGGVNPLGAIPPADLNMNGVIEPGESGMRGPDGCVIAVTNIGGGFGPGGLPAQYEANPLRFKATTGGAVAKLQLTGSAASVVDIDMDGDLDITGGGATPGSLTIQTPAAVNEGEWSGFASNDNVNLQHMNKSDPQCNQNISNVITPTGQINTNVVLNAFRNPLPVGETMPVVQVDSDGFDTLVNVVLCHQAGQKVQVIGRGAPRPQGGAGVGSGGVSGLNKEVKMVSAAYVLS